MSIRPPPHLFDRAREWSALSRFVRDPRPGLTLGLVYGRRRQGKSYLLESLVEAAGGFYHLALEQGSRQALRGLGADMTRESRAPGPIVPSDWGSAVDALLAMGSRSRPFTVVLDEFPNLVAAEPSLPSIIQRALGTRPAAAAAPRTRLILCGSALSVMNRLISGPAPLRGRAGLDLVVHPFGYRESAAYWGLEHDPELALLLHAVVGGTPAYRTLLSERGPATHAAFARWIVRHVLSPASPLFREGRYLLAEEPSLSDRALYHSVLTAIADGRTRLGQIAESTGRPVTGLAHPLNVLEDVRLVVQEQDALRARRSTYRIAEPVVRFHHAVMRPYLARLERGDAARVWREVRPTFASLILGPHFEELAREWTRTHASASTLGGRPSLVASTVVNDKRGRTSHEVDVVGVSAGESRVLVLGEAKWGTAGTDSVANLDRVRVLLAEQGHVDVSRVRLLVFARRFTERLQRAAAEGRVGLVDLERLYRGD